MIWFGWALWYINHCRLFNAKSSFYVYIKYTWFGLVEFYGISTIVGYLIPHPLYMYILKCIIWFGLLWFYNISTTVDYLMPNPVNKYILNYVICKHFVDDFLNEPELYFWIQLNGFKYCYLTLIILFNITHSFACICITSKNYWFSRHCKLEKYNPNLKELILKPVLMYLNVFSYWLYL